LFENQVLLFARFKRTFQLFRAHLLLKPSAGKFQTKRWKISNQGRKNLRTGRF